MTTMFQQQPQPGTQQPAGHKSVLICSTCGHENSLGGDWRVTETTGEDGQYLVYDCPVCRTTVIAQPQLDG